MTAENAYRSVRLLTRFGPYFALGAAVIVWVVSGRLAIEGAHPFWVGLGIVGGFAVGFLVMVLVDLARLISDMLIPR